MPERQGQQAPRPAASRAPASCRGPSSRQAQQACWLAEPLGLSLSCLPHAELSAFCTSPLSAALSRLWQPPPGAEAASEWLRGPKPGHPFWLSHGLLARARQLAPSGPSCAPHKQRVARPLGPAAAPRAKQPARASLPLLRHLLCCLHCGVCSKGQLLPLLSSPSAHQPPARQAAPARALAPWLLLRG